MAEYTNVSRQEVAPQSAVIFTETAVPCNMGYIRHRDGSGSFLLNGGNNYFNTVNSCNCRNSVNFLVSFGANVGIPTTGTAGEISLGLAIDGIVIPSSIVRVTPTATDAYFDVDRTINVPIWKGCCQSVSLVNVSNQSIYVQEANILFSR